MVLEDQTTLEGQEIQHHPFVQAPLVVLSHQADHQHPVVLKVYHVQNQFTHLTEKSLVHIISNYREFSVRFQNFYLQVVQQSLQHLLAQVHHGIPWY